VYRDDLLRGSEVAEGGGGGDEKEGFLGVREPGRDADSALDLP